jgi:3-dehydrosphinganine reductase
MNLSHAVALVTGGSSGIGLATAKLLAASGAHVWLVARDGERLHTALSEVNAARRSTTQCCGALSADVADEHQAAAAVHRVATEAGPPEIVVNSAGIVYAGYVEALDPAAFRRQIEVNYLGAVHVVQAALPAMLDRHTGHIVNVCSVAGFLGVFGYAAYGASKYALRGYSEALRAELKPRGIHVAVVFPPDTDTPQLAFDRATRPPEVDIMLGRKISTKSPEFVARAILDGMARRRYIITPGLDTTLLYRLSGVVGSLQYRIMDHLIMRALHETGHGRTSSVLQKAEP